MDERPGRHKAVTAEADRLAGFGAGMVVVLVMSILKGFLGESLERFIPWWLAVLLLVIPSLVVGWLAYCVLVRLRRT